MEWEGDNNCPSSINLFNLHLAFLCIDSVLVPKAAFLSKITECRKTLWKIGNIGSENCILKDSGIDSSGLNPIYHFHNDKLWVYCAVPGWLLLQLWPSPLDSNDPTIVSHIYLSFINTQRKVYQKDFEIEWVWQQSC